MVLTNTLLWNNSAGSGYPEIVLWAASPTVTYCDVKGGWPGTGNINADPLFSDPNKADYHLTWSSPCRGSGDNSAQDLPDTDYEGDPRIYQGTVDIGADEFYTHLYYTGEATPGGEIQGKVVGTPGTWPVGLFFGSGVLETPRYHRWGEFWLEEPWFVVPLIPIPATGILTMPTTLPLAPPAPWDLPMQGLVGLNSDSLTNLCVLEVR